MHFFDRYLFLELFGRLVIQYMRRISTFKPEFMNQVDLHGFRHAQVMIAALGEDHLVNFCECNQSLIDPVYSQYRVPIVMPVDNYLRTIQPQGLQDRKYEKERDTRRILNQNVVIMLR